MSLSLIHVPQQMVIMIQYERPIKTVEVISSCLANWLAVSFSFAKFPFPGKLERDEQKPCVELICNETSRSLKLWISLGLNIVGNILDDVITQVNKMYKISLVSLRHYNEECYILYL